MAKLFKFHSIRERACIKILFLPKKKKKILPWLFLGEGQLRLTEIKIEWSCMYTKSIQFYIIKGNSSITNAVAEWISPLVSTVAYQEFESRVEVNTF